MVKRLNDGLALIIDLVEVQAYIYLCGITVLFANTTQKFTPPERKKMHNNEAKRKHKKVFDHRNEITKYML